MDQNNHLKLHLVCHHKLTRKAVLHLQWLNSKKENSKTLNLLNHQAACQEMNPIKVSLNKTTQMTLVLSAMLSYCSVILLVQRFSRTLRINKTNIQSKMKTTEGWATEIIIKAVLLILIQFNHCSKIQIAISTKKFLMLWE